MEHSLSQVSQPWQVGEKEPVEQHPCIHSAAALGDVWEDCGQFFTHVPCGDP